MQEDKDRKVFYTLRVCQSDAKLVGKREAAKEMEEPELWATYDVRDMIVFHEHDFEIFIDAPGGGRWYKELELNALNTVWNLLLDRPYADGGEEYSGRVATPGAPRRGPAPGGASSSSPTRTTSTSPTSPRTAPTGRTASPNPTPTTT